MEENACEMVEDKNLSPEETTKLHLDSMKQKFYATHQKIV